jgi:hypothetical protein
MRGVAVSDVSKQKEQILSVDESKLVFQRPKHSDAVKNSRSG